MSKTIYIAGKVTGLSNDACTEKFNNAQMYLYDQGHTAVVNPVQRVYDKGWIDEKWKEDNWQLIMRFCFEWLMKCDAIYCLPCWRQSRGATLERYVAGQLGLEIIDAPETLQIAPV